MTGLPASLSPTFCGGLERSMPRSVPVAGLLYRRHAGAIGIRGSRPAYIGSSPAAASAALCASFSTPMRISSKGTKMLQLTRSA